MSRLVTLVLAAALTSVACGSALAPADLYQQSVERMAQQTFHIDGKIDVNVKDDSSMSMALSMTMQGDAVAPDRFRGTVKVKLFGQEASQEVVTIGGRSWTRVRGGTWQEADATNALTSTGVFVSGKHVKKLTELAAETIGGRAVRHLVLQVDLEALAESDPRLAEGLKEFSGALDESTTALTLDHWVDSESGLVRRQRVAMDLAVEGATVAVTVTLDYSRIGEPIQPPIEAPR